MQMHQPLLLALDPAATFHQPAPEAVLQLGTALLVQKAPAVQHSRSVVLGLVCLVGFLDVPWFSLMLCSFTSFCCSSEKAVLLCWHWPVDPIVASSNTQQ
jgi:hypothetical protein